MTIEGNKALVRRAYLDGLNSRNMDIVQEAFSSDYICHVPGQQAISRTEFIAEVLDSFFTAFPDLFFTIEDQVGEGDKVVARWSAQGTHEGLWRGFRPRGEGIQPTGRKVTLAATDIYLIRGGRIAEEWGTLEQLAVLEQMGMVSPPE